MSITPAMSDFLTKLGVIPPDHDPASITITEQVTLEKFEGDVLVERIDLGPDTTIKGT